MAVHWEALAHAAAALVVAAAAAAWTMMVALAALGHCLLGADVLEAAVHQKLKPVLLVTCSGILACLHSGLPALAVSFSVVPHPAPLLAPSCVLVVLPDAVSSPASSTDSQVGGQMGGGCEQNESRVIICVGCYDKVLFPSCSCSCSCSSSCSSSSCSSSSCSSPSSSASYVKLLLAFLCFLGSLAFLLLLLSLSLVALLLLLCLHLRLVL